MPVVLLHRPSSGHLSWPRWSAEHRNRPLAARAHPSRRAVEAPVVDLVLSRARRDSTRSTPGDVIRRRPPPGTRARGRRGFTADRGSR
jgi:hypothetical protein